MQNEMDVQRALHAIAAAQGVSVLEVRRNIELALREGRRNPDPSVQAYWRSIPCRGRIPTVDEVVMFIADRVSGQAVQEG